MRWAFAAVPLLLAVLLLAPATLGGKVLSAGDQPLHEPPFVPPAGGPANPLQYDAAYQFEPDGLEVRKALRAGRLPTWTTAQSAGAPLLAAQQSAPLFPLTWIGVVFGFYGSLAWIAVLKLALAGWGTVLLGRGLGLGRPAALLAGISFAFGTYLVAWLMHPHVNAYVLLPWLLWLGDRLARRGTVRDAALLGGGVGLAWLGGQPESALLVTLTTAAWLVVRLPRGSAWRRGGLALGAGALGLAVGAVMLLPLLEALRQAFETSRSAPPLPLRSALTLIAPEFWGRPDGAQVAGPGNFTERTLYAGVLPSILALAGLVARRPDGAQRFFAVLAVVGVAVSWDTGPIASVASDLPVLSTINVTRALALTALALAVLAGFGLQRLLDGDARERRRMAIATGVLVALPVVIAVALHPGRLGDLGGAAGQVLDRHGDPALLGTTAMLRWAVLGLLALVVIVIRRRPMAWVACALAAVDLLAVGAGYNPAISRAQAQPPITPALQALQRLTQDGGRVAGLAGLQPNSASRWGLTDARGHELPLLERGLDLTRALGDWLIFTAKGTPLTAPQTRLLGVYGVRAVLLAPDAAPPAGLPVVHAGADGVVVRNPDALPDAWVAYGWRPSAGEPQSLALTRSRDLDALRDEPAIETADAPPAGPAPAATPAVIARRTETSVDVDLDAARPGRLVLLDTFYPGWHAEVDGRPVAIEAADTAFRAVAVPAGQHRVRFEYRPASVRWGAIISVVALVLLALAIIFGGSRRRELRD